MSSGPSSERSRFCPGGEVRRSAFTLLEMVISLGLLALLAGLVVMAGAAVTNSWSRLEKRQQQFAELMRVDRTLDTILSNTVAFSWSDDAGAMLPYFRGAPDRVRLAYRHRIAIPGEGGLRFVLLELNGDDLVARYHSRPFLDEERVFQDGRTSILASGIAELRLRYAIIDSETDVAEPPRWVEQWRPEDWPLDQRRLHARPLAVHIGLEWEDGRVEHWIRRLPGTSRFERRGVWRPLKE